MEPQVVLMVILGDKELGKWDHLCRHRSCESLRPIDCADESLSGLLLIRIGIEDHRTILRPDVRPLPVDLGRIVSNSKENVEKLNIGYRLRVETDLDRLRMPRISRSDFRIAGRIFS